MKVDRLFVNGKSLGKEKLIEPQNKISDLKQTNKKNQKIFNKSGILSVGNNLFLEKDTDIWCRWQGFGSRETSGGPL